MLLRSLHGPVLGSPRSLTIGSDDWLLIITVPQSLFLAGPSTDRAAVGRLRPQMNFLTLLSTGLAIQIHGSEQRGRRAKDWRSSSRTVEPYWFWTGWSRSKIPLVRKKEECESLPSRRFCASLQPSTQGFALSPRGHQSLILRITSAPPLCVVTWNNYQAMLVRTCSERSG